MEGNIGPMQPFPQVTDFKKKFRLRCGFFLFSVYLYTCPVKRGFLHLRHLLVFPEVSRAGGFLSAGEQQADFWTASSPQPPPPAQLKHEDC